MHVQRVKTGRTHFAAKINGNLGVDALQNIAAKKAPGLHSCVRLAALGAPIKTV